VSCEPVELVGAEQDEMNHQRKHKQEREERNQHPSRIKQQP
jgi:hypothetical protein